jgi:hypothetical protein
VAFTELLSMMYSKNFNLSSGILTPFDSSFLVECKSSLKTPLMKEELIHLNMQQVSCVDSLETDTVHLVVEDTFQINSSLLLSALSTLFAKDSPPILTK